jgi:hypothetical protein
MKRANNLPVEIWRMILHLALETPASLEPSPMPPLLFRTRNPNRALVCGRCDAPFDDALASCMTQGSCMKVSKLWRAIAEDIVYKWILLSHTSGLESLADLFDVAHDGAEPQDTLSFSVGARLKRLDYRRKDLGREKDNEILYSIIRFCPGLVVLNAYCDLPDNLWRNVDLAYTRSYIQSSSFGYSLRFLT